jgi:hypothetical protein
MLNVAVLSVVKLSVGMLIVIMLSVGYGYKTFSMTTPSIMGLFSSLSISDIQHNDTQL